MTLTDFYNFAVMAAKERGIENPAITVISGNYEGVIKHSCSVWFPQKQKHIRSQLHENPVSAIQAFKDAIDFENKTYSKLSEDIVL